MRKPFRTTIDEELLITLKKWAVENNANANDIIENLIRDKIYQNYLNKNDDRISDMSELEKKVYMERLLTNDIRNTLDKFSSSYTPRNLPEIMAETIFKIIDSSKLFDRKK